MKTPEQYLRAAMHEVKIVSLGYSKEVAIEALKLMREDHEKEFIEFVNYYEHLTPVEKVTPYENGDGSIGVYPTPPEEIIRRFRNKQQDR